VNCKITALSTSSRRQDSSIARQPKVEIDAPRGKIRLDAYHNPVHTVYVRKVKTGDKFQNTVVGSYPNTSRFWKWTREAFMAMPSYSGGKRKWVK
jgi:hypothetical protein